MNFEACIKCSLTKLWGSGYNLKGKILKLCLNWVLNFSSELYFLLRIFSCNLHVIIKIFRLNRRHTWSDIALFSHIAFLIFSEEFVRDSFIYFPGFFKGWLRIQISRGSFFFIFLFVHFRVRDKNPCNHKIS